MTIPYTVIILFLKEKSLPLDKNTSLSPLGEKLSCNGNNIILLFPTNNDMSLESVIACVITLLENSKIILPPFHESLSHNWIFFFSLQFLQEQ